jgi:hypothetical protein
VVILSSKSSAEVSNYNARYYAKKKAKILEKRRIRYHTDPLYRINVKNKARRRYIKKTSKQLGYTIKKIDGIEVFTIRYVSKVSGKNDATIRAWEKEGIIPLTIFTDSRGWRLYTAQQIELIAEGFRRYDKNEWSKTEVHNYLKIFWDYGGVK